MVAEAHPITPAMRAVNETLQQGRHVQALAQCRALIEADPDNYYGWNLLAAIYMAQEQFLEALQASIEVLRRCGDNADFIRNHALILSKLGRFIEAEALVRRSIELDPRNGQGYHLLSVVRRFSEIEPMVAQMERQVAQPQESDGEAGNRAYIHFALGKIYDGLGDHGRALAHYRAGNGARNGRYDPQAEQGRFAALAAQVRAGFPGSGGEFGVEDATPIFILGLPRSGSTLLAQMLASHPAIGSAGESRDLPRLAMALPKILDSEHESYPACLARMTREEAQRVAQLYLDRLRGVGSHARREARIIDKQPLNFLHIPLLRALFPAATIVHIRRDPRDTLLSCFFQDFSAGYEYSFSLDNLLDYYAQFREYMALLERRYGEAIVEVRYESLVENSEAVLKRVVAAAGLEWSEQCLLHHRNSSTGINTASSWQARQKVYRSSLGKWRHYQPLLPEFFASVGAMADRDAARAAG